MDLHDDDRTTLAMQPSQALMSQSEIACMSGRLDGRDETKMTFFNIYDCMGDGEAIIHLL